MERTTIRLGGIEVNSSVMNASGPRSAERGEIYELSAVHRGAVVFKSCNIAGLEQPENLKNNGVEYFAAIARELRARHKIVVGSVVGNTEDEIVSVAQTLDRAGANILELNLADDYVMNSVAPFASFERLKSLVGRVRGETSAVLAVKLPPKGLSFTPRAIADLMKSLRVSILVCANDLPKDLDIDIKSGAVKGAGSRALASERVLSRGRIAARYRRGRRREHRARRLHRASHRREGGADRLGADQGRRGRARPHRSRTRCAARRERPSLGFGDHR